MPLKTETDSLYLVIFITNPSINLSILFINIFHADNFIIEFIRVCEIADIWM